MIEIELLNRAKDITGSDRKTALALKTSHQRLSFIRNGVRGMDEWIAGELAEMVGDDPLQTICKVREQNARTHKEKAAWHRWAGAACAMLTVGVICATSFGSVGYAAALPVLFAPEIYIMRT